MFSSATAAVRQLVMLQLGEVGRRNNFSPVERIQALSLCQLPAGGMLNGSGGSLPPSPPGPAVRDYWLLVHIPVTLQPGCY